MTAQAARPRAARPPLKDAPARVRQRQRADGSWRVWWEPEAALRRLGFEVTELDARRPTWSLRRAEALNAEARRAREGAAFSPSGAGRTVADLIRLYLASPDFSRLRPATQAGYRASLRRFADKFGAAPVAAFTKPMLVDWYEGLFPRGVRHAQAEVRIASVLFTYGERRGWIGQNPALRLKMVSPDPRGRLIGWDEFDALVAAALAEGLDGVAMALRLGLYTAQRQTDVLAARLEDVAPHPDHPLGVWRLRRSKRGNLGALPIHPDLAPHLAERRARAEAGPIVQRADGQGYRADHFRHHFARVRAAAAKALPSVADVQFRDLRRTALQLAREGGVEGRNLADLAGNDMDGNALLSRTYNPPSLTGAARAVSAIRRPAGKDTA